VADEVLVERPRPGVGLLRIHRPERLNALSQGVLEAIGEALGALEADPEVQAVVLTGDARAFAAGADIAEFSEQDLAELLNDRRYAAWARIRGFKKILIAAVSGYALGGGFELAMSADLVVASETARFGQPEINLGLMPGAGGTQRLVRLLGRVRAMEVVLGERTLGADEALRVGLVNRVVPKELYLEEALTLAERIARKAPLALRLIKDAVRMAEELGLEDGLRYERRNFYLLYGSEDAREGIRAFLEKRAPEWRGR
jgi:Enoyl-CoA hydratase/carnithine racemase